MNDLFSLVAPLLEAVASWWGQHPISMAVLTAAAVLFAAIITATIGLATLVSWMVHRMEQWEQAEEARNRACGP